MSSYNAVLNENNELPSLAALEQNIIKTKEKLNPKEVPKASDAKMVVRMGLELISGAIVGSVLGIYADKWLGTSPFSFIILFFMGSIAGFFSMMKAIEANDKKQIKNELNRTKENSE
jgi:F0F1-type ATP synthase assembly protein I